MNLTRWEWFLLGLAAFVAIRALVRMLLVRRDQLQTEIERKLLQELKAEKAKAANEAAAAALTDLADNVLDQEDTTQRAA